jgi:hypothetical protein
MDNRDLRPFACELCELRFTTKQFLQRHYIVHTEERSFKCSFCDNSYKYKKGLNRHYKKVHYQHYHNEVILKYHDKTKLHFINENFEDKQKTSKDPKKHTIKIWNEENCKSNSQTTWPALLDMSNLIVTSPFPLS